MGLNLPFTNDDLMYAASGASYQRGLGYLNSVEDLQITGTWVTATVFGNDAYDVRLRFGDAGPGTTGLRGECSCPFGAEGNFCKHCVATGLVALRGGDYEPDGIPAASDPRVGRETLAGWLRSLSKDDLIAEVLDLVDEDQDLRRRFELRASVQQKDAAGVREAVRRLIWVNHYIDDNEAGAYAANVLQAADAICELTDAGAAEQAVEVAREAIGWLAQCLEVVDDSEGEVGGAAFELLYAHLLACQAAPPDPVELAGYLAELYLTDTWQQMPALMAYAEILGDDGTAALHELVAAAYAANPDDLHVRHAMESVIEAEGDVDALVAFYATHLDQHGWQHLRIVNTLDEAGRADEALDWAKRGVRGSPRPDTRLVEYLADRYRAAGRTDDVLDLRRTLFTAERSLANYQALREAALACVEWDRERETALALLRKDAKGTKGGAWSNWGGAVLIDALIDDGDLAAAWTAAESVASEPQWIRLANASVAERPADALTVYVKVIDRLTENTGDKIYQEIAAHLLAARSCHEALGTMDKFRQYMVWLRVAQKRKRNLMAILDQSGL